MNPGFAHLTQDRESRALLLTEPASRLAVLFNGGDHCKRASQNRQFIGRSSGDLPSRFCDHEVVLCLLYVSVSQCVRKAQADQHGSMWGLSHTWSLTSYPHRSLFAISIPWTVLSCGLLSTGLLKHTVCHVLGVRDLQRCSHRLNPGGVDPDGQVAEEAVH